MKNDRAGLIQNAQVHGSSVQINSAVMGMLLRIESHLASSLLLSPFGDDLHIGMVGFYQARLGGGLNQYQGHGADNRRTLIPS